MNDYRDQQNIDRPITPIVSNNSNFIKGKPGEPVLISWDDAVTLFHEFGHALHGLASNCNYPRQSGTAVARDYVEFPSQLNEHWLMTPEILTRFAVHYKTGEPIPQELVDKIKNAATFNQGFSTVEYLASALIDMKLHLAGDVQIDPDTFERRRSPNSRCRANRDAAPHAALQSRLFQRRLLRRVLQLPLVGCTHRRRGRVIPSRRLVLRYNARQKFVRKHLVGRRYHRSSRRLPPLPWPRCGYQGLIEKTQDFRLNKSLSHYPFPRFGGEGRVRGPTGLEIGS